MTTGTAIGIIIGGLLGLAISYWLLFLIVRAAVTAALKRVVTGQNDALVQQNTQIIRNLSAHTDLLKAIAAGGPEGSS